MSEMTEEQLEGFLKWHDSPVIQDLVAEVRRLRAENAALRERIASGLLLAEVDLSGEIEYAEYVIVYEAYPYPMTSKRHFGISVYDCTWHAPKIIRAYGPLPTEGEQG